MASEARKLDALGRFTDQDKTAKSGKPKAEERGLCLCRETSLHRAVDEKTNQPKGVIGNDESPAFVQGEARRIVNPACPIHGDASKAKKK